VLQSVEGKNQPPERIGVSRGDYSETNMKNRVNLGAMGEGEQWKESQANARHALSADRRGGRKNRLNRRDNIQRLLSEVRKVTRRSSVDTNPMGPRRDDCRDANRSRLHIGSISWDLVKNTRLEPRPRDGDRNKSISSIERKRAHARGQSSHYHHNTCKAPPSQSTV